MQIFVTADIRIRIFERIGPFFVTTTHSMMIEVSPYPLRFQPLIKQAIWGGSKLGRLLGKEIGQRNDTGESNDYAESWELVDHGPDQSILLNGSLAGQTLSQLIHRDRKWLLGAGGTGGAVTGGATAGFPLLLKYLDCHRVLSVQVHPDDAYAATMAVPDYGKTEAWYVVDVEPGSLIYAGLKTGVTRDQLARAMAAGETDSVLHSFEPARGDCVFIPAGTIHALGAGLVIAEIQQSSDTTFRLFDWNRLGADGQPRPLHLEQSLEVTDYLSGPVDPQKRDQTLRGWQPLVQCDKFTLRSLENGSDVIGGDGRFHIVTIPRGKATVTTDNQAIRMTCGQSLLLPAAMPHCSIAVEPHSTALTASVS